MAQAFYVRNPYPVPDISREGAWISRGPVLGDKVSPSDRNWNVKLSAHERLFAHHTLNSIRRDRRLIRPQVPHDALDLALNSVYAHSRDTLVSKMYVPIQPETLGRETWRVLRNEIKILPEPPKPDRPRHVSGHPDEELKSVVRVPLSADKSRCHSGPTLPRRIHPSSVKLNIEGPHMDQSNPGYSRKIDGTFYSI
ncbi:cilia- and flagella-associated protein 276 [Temnothorax americanus]|uniref:cilia- and flagella-associated protein 276 n=1 Tax=Temnothorax americanus TaxID=1964332 RepID=UPI004068FA23